MDRWPVSSKGSDSLAPLSSHTTAVLEAMFVTLLWSSSYVLIKIGLDEIPALTFAGLRYSLAAVVLLSLFLYRGHHRSIGSLGPRDTIVLVVLGILLYAVTQGAQFVALQYVRAATVSLVLSFTPVIVALVSIPSMGERATLRQWFWLGILLLGITAYFYPFALGSGAVTGLGIVIVGLVANASAAVLGRVVNRDGDRSPLAVTAISMGIGSAVLLPMGISMQGLPSLSISAWAIVLWLALVNTAFAFTLWNRTLRTLSATESSAINNTMLVQVAVFGWAFLGESLGRLDLLGISLVAVGAVLVQLSGSR